MFSFLTLLVLIMLFIPTILMYHFVLRHCLYTQIKEIPVMHGFQ